MFIIDRPKELNSIFNRKLNQTKGQRKKNRTSKKFNSFMELLMKWNVENDIIILFYFVLVSCTVPFSLFCYFSVLNWLWWWWFITQIKFHLSHTHTHRLTDTESRPSNQNRIFKYCQGLCIWSSPDHHMFVCVLNTELGNFFLFCFQLHLLIIINSFGNDSNHEFNLWIC